MYNKCIKFTNTFLDLLIAALRKSLLSVTDNTIKHVICFI